MITIADHILDIAQNSVNAGATKIEIFVMENALKKIFSFKIKDNGCGIKKEILPLVFDPFFTTRDKHIRKVGLGLPFLKENAELTGGSVNLYSKEGVGTNIEVIFKTDSIDCLPAGDLSYTFFTLLISKENVLWDIKRSVDEKFYEIKTVEILNIFSASELKVPMYQKMLLEYLEDLEKNLDLKN